MLGHTKTRPTRRTAKSTVKPGSKNKERSIPWRETLKEHLEKYTEAGVLLRAHRERLEMTQKDLGEAIGVSQNHISEMENGKRSVGKMMAKKFSVFFKTDYRRFL